MDVRALLVPGVQVAPGHGDRVPPRVPAEALTIGAAVGPAKVSAIRAALKGRLINGLITDEATASIILKQ